MALIDRTSASTMQQHARGPAVTIDIGELVLTGFPAAQRHHIGDAVQAELTRLIAERGFALHPDLRTSSETIDAGAFTIAAHATSAVQIGRRIAGSVYAQLTDTRAKAR